MLLCEVLLIWFLTETPVVVDQTDDLLHHRDSGLETAFERAKILSKYLGELIIYVKKKAHIGKTQYCIFFFLIECSVFLCVNDFVTFCW